jgi:hypothetical protein
VGGGGVGGKGGGGGRGEKWTKPYMHIWIIKEKWKKKDYEDVTLKKKDTYLRKEIHIRRAKIFQQFCNHHKASLHFIFLPHKKHAKPKFDTHQIPQRWEIQTTNTP